jgi:hypothetical protein
MPNELAQSTSASAVIDLPQAIDVTRSYWFAMLAASAFGTNCRRSLGGDAVACVRS